MLCILLTVTCAVQSVVCCQSFTLKPLVIPLSSYFASRTLSHCKHDIGTLLWLNAGTVERVPNPLFDGFVRCSAHGHPFVRLWYYHGKIYTLASYYFIKGQVENTELWKPKYGKRSMEVTHQHTHTPDGVFVDTLG